jgi:hypothetical protein
VFNIGHRTVKVLSKISEGINIEFTNE